MKQYQLIVFDWDGTVMDSVGKIVQCMQIAARQCDLPVPSAAEVGNIIGISLHPAIKILFNLSQDPVVDTVVEAYKAAYLEQDVTPCPMFDGAVEMLNALHQQGYTLAVATGKARRGLDRAWRHTATGQFFTASRTACEAQSKPSSDMLEQLLQETGINVTEAVMIGDTVYDMQMAEQIGMDRIGVTYGVHDAARLQRHSPVHIADSIGQLHQFLARA